MVDRSFSGEVFVLIELARRAIQGIKDEQTATFLYTRMRKFLFDTHISSSQPEQ
jgi:hypothetical protein